MFLLRRPPSSEMTSFALPARVPLRREKALKHGVVDVVKSGWVSARSRFLGRWQRRFLVLTKSHLCCFRNQQGRPELCLDLAGLGVSASAATDAGNPSVFVVGDASGRLWSFLAQSDLDKEVWEQELQRARLSRALRSAGSEASSRSRRRFSDFFSSLRSRSSAPARQSPKCGKRQEVDPAQLGDLELLGGSVLEEGPPSLGSGEAFYGTFEHCDFSCSPVPFSVDIPQRTWTSRGMTHGISVTLEGDRFVASDGCTVLQGALLPNGDIDGEVIREGRAGGRFTLHPLRFDAGLESLEHPGGDCGADFDLAGAPTRMPSSSCAASDDSERASFLEEQAPQVVPSDVATDISRPRAVRAQNLADAWRTFNIGAHPRALTASARG